MSVIAAALNPLYHYIDFSGRASRREFILFHVFIFLFALLLGILGANELILDILSLLIFLPGLGLYCRRLHDMGYSGWYLVAYMIGLPVLLIIVGVILSAVVVTPESLILLLMVVYAVIYIGAFLLFCMRGISGGNEYGPPPVL